MTMVVSLFVSEKIDLRLFITNINFVQIKNKNGSPVRR